ncbi:hypothetical protein AAFF_G00251810 [Aldrovandia affinis]|uniref:Uncharacterized protein n=1 Tax=Aldrovandia affinis TaxID=143900 RepID=A0AAD7SVF4_9TELE|nr:hypothetical protein AAFF_G00251810 [Aldrovandia affinis]
MAAARYALGGLMNPRPPPCLCLARHLHLAHPSSADAHTLVNIWRRKSAGRLLPPEAVGAASRPRHLVGLGITESFHRRCLCTGAVRLPGRDAGNDWTVKVNHRTSPFPSDGESGSHKVGPQFILRVERSCF